MTAFDSSPAAVNSSVSPITYSQTNNGNGVFIAVTTFAGTTNDVTAVSYGGVTIPLLGFVPSNNVGPGGIALYGLTGPTVPGGANTVSVSFSGANSHNVGSESVTAAGALGTVFTSFASGLSVSVTVNGTTANGLIVSAVCQGSFSAISATSPNVLRFTKLTSNGSASDDIAGGTDPSTGGGANQAVAWSAVGSDFWGIVAVEVLPAAAGAPVLPPNTGGQALQRKRRVRRQRAFTPLPVPTAPFFAATAPAANPSRRQLPAAGRISTTRTPPAQQAAPVTGPPIYPRGRPVAAQSFPAPPGGRVSSRDGSFAGTGPPARQWDQPVRAQPETPRLTGRADSRAGILGQAGPPARQWDHPAGAPVPPAGRGGTVTSRDGPLGQAGPPVRPADGPVAAQGTRGLPARGRVARSYGTFTALAPQAGPPLRPASGPVRAQPYPPPRAGAADGRAGTFGQAGPPARVWDAPAQAQRPLPPPGRVSRSSGTFTLVIPGAGPPVRVWDSPVQARAPLPAPGRVTRRAGPLGVAGPPVRPPDGPVQARRYPPPQGGRVSRSSGTWTFVVVGAGPPLYPLGHPVAARAPLPAAGRVIRRAGPVQPAGPPVRPLDGPVRAQPPLPSPGRATSRHGAYGGVGPPVRPLDGPVGVYRQQPPPPGRGRVAADRGPLGQAGPPVRPLRHALRAQPQFPRLDGRADWRAGAYTAPPPPPDIVKGHITATVTEPREGRAGLAEPREGGSLTAEPRAGSSAVAEPREGTSGVSERREGYSGVS